MRSIFLICLFMAGCKAAVPQSAIVLEDGQYFDGQRFILFAEIVINGQKIEAIHSEKTRTGGKRVSVKGKYLIPGLIDAHTHLYGSPALPYIMGSPLFNAKSYLNCGVTTVVDLFYGEQEVPLFRDSIKHNPLAYTTVLFSGAIITAPNGHGTEYGVPTRTPTNPYEAGKMTNDVIDNGMDVIKFVYQAYSSEHTLDKYCAERITTVAHQRGKKVFAHIDNAAEAMDCIDVGVDALAHAPGGTLVDTVLDKIKNSGVPVIPTFTVAQAFYGGFERPYMTDSLLLATADKRYLSAFPDSAIPPYGNHTALSEACQNLMKLVKWKIPIVAGTDAGNYAVFYGYSLHHEIEQYTHAGMTNAEALNTATRNIQYIFPDMKTGKIEPGYDADIVVLDRNPLHDIRNTKSIRMVIHKGWIAK